MIIDCHTHVFSPWVRAKRDEYEQADPGFALLYGRKEAKLATADELVSSMDKTGIDFSVITNIGWQSAALCTESNDYILESVARYPRRLAGFISLRLNSPQAAIAVRRSAVSPVARNCSRSASRFRCSAWAGTLG